MIIQLLNINHGIMNGVFRYSVSFCILFNCACNKAPLCDCFESAGNPSEVTREVPYFDNITAQDDINVVISMGSSEQVMIQGGSNLLQNISATVSDRTLTLKNNNICDWLRSYHKSVITVYVTMPSVNFITNNGIGTISSADTITSYWFQVFTTSAGDINLVVNSTTIDGHLFGSGDVTLSGYCNQLSCTYNAGTGFLYCSNLVTSYTFISTNTTGDCYVNASSLLQAQLYQRGNVYYKGSPVVQASIYGQGKVIKD